MKRYRGRTAYRGIAIGPIRVHQKKASTVVRRKIEQTGEEWNRVEQAIQRTRQQLKNLYEKAQGEVGVAGAALFEVHQLMLEDEDFLEAIRSCIETEQVNAEYAVARTGDNFSAMFLGMEDEYMQARAADVKDVSGRILQNLRNDEEQAEAYGPAIVVATDLSPSETIEMEQTSILAFVTAQGSVNSHTAILARMRSLPALVGTGVEVETLTDGSMAIVDGFRGELIIEPTEEQLREARAKQAGEQERQALLRQVKGKPSVTRGGRKLLLYANIASPADLGYALENDAEGIGLFRSEFLYLGRTEAPTEEEQLQAYRQVAQTMAGRPVIIRTFDIGADKQVPYLGLEQEENPAMGYRAIRICLDRPELFETQLRAILRAGVYGDISIMYPMITSLEEVRRCKEHLMRAAAALKEAGIPWKLPRQGIMIETPAAALIADRLAQEVDFFSIGTNDLTQYTLAIDRQNPRLEAFYRPDHEALWRLLGSVVRQAHEAGIWVGLCGELGGDDTFLERLLDLGLDELSMAPSELLRLKSRLRELP